MTLTIVSFIFLITGFILGRLTYPAKNKEINKVKFNIRNTFITSIEDNKVITTNL